MRSTFFLAEDTNNGKIESGLRLRAQVGDGTQPIVPRHPIDHSPGRGLDDPPNGLWGEIEGRGQNDEQGFPEAGEVRKDLSRSEGQGLLKGLAADRIRKIGLGCDALEPDLGTCPRGCASIV